MSDTAITPLVGSLTLTGAAPTRNQNSTFFLDYEGGNNANNGTSFAQRWATITLGATTARIAPGDTIRVMGSPAPTSLAQNGVWTEAQDIASQPARSPSSSTNATPIVFTFTSGNYVSLNPHVGDTVLVNGHLTNTNANGVWMISAIDAVGFKITIVNANGTNSVGNGVGSAGTVKNITNSVVKLASSITKAIACVGNKGIKTNWTASANVTCTVLTTDFKEGADCQQIVPAAAFTTGLAAFWATGTLDLSPYKQVSFWVKQTSGTIAIAGDSSLRLCTDTVGATPVHTVPIPALAALNVWFRVTWDNAAALNAAIASIAFYVDTDRGAQTFLIDCVTACKDSTVDDSLSLTSLLGKNTTGETWWSIQSINDVRVVLDMYNGTIPAANPSRGYTGTTATVTTYKRETIKLAPQATAGGSTQTIQDSGSAALGLIYFEGGWDRTAMTTQNLETWLDGQNGNGTGVTTNSKNFVSVNLISTVNFATGYINDGTDNTFSNCTALGSQSTAFSSTGDRLTLSGNVYLIGCGTGVGLSNGGANSLISGTLKCLSNSLTGYQGPSLATRFTGDLTVSNNGVSGMLTADYTTFANITAKKNNGAGISLGFNMFVASATLVANTTNISGTNVTGAFIGGGTSTLSNNADVVLSGGDVSLKGFTFGSATKTSVTAYTGSTIYSQNHGGVANDHRIFADGGSSSLGLIASDATNTHGSSTLSWKFSPTSTTRNINFPAELSLAKIACVANQLVTVSAWHRRSNTALTNILLCKGGQLAGVAGDISASQTASANIWEQLTITFTPTEAGVIEIVCQCYGGTSNNGWVDDMSISQA